MGWRLLRELRIMLQDLPENRFWAVWLLLLMAIVVVSWQGLGL